MSSDREAAKYPFLKEAVDLIEELQFTVDELIKPFYESILERAEERVSQAIEKGEANVDLMKTPLIISFFTTQ